MCAQYGRVCVQLRPRRKPERPPPDPRAELRIPVDPVQGGRHDVLLLRVDRPGAGFHPGWHPIRSHARPRRHSPRCLHQFVRHPAKEESIGPIEVLDRVTVLLELLGKRNDDAFGAADVTEPVPVLILGDFAYELSAMGTQAREDVLDVVDGDIMRRMPSVFTGAFFGSALTAAGV